MFLKNVHKRNVRLAITFACTITMLMPTNVHATMLSDMLCIKCEQALNFKITNEPKLTEKDHSKISIFEYKPERKKKVKTHTFSLAKNNAGNITVFTKNAQVESDKMASSVDINAINETDEDIPVIIMDDSDIIIDDEPEEIIEESQEGEYLDNDADEEDTVDPSQEGEYFEDDDTDVITDESQEGEYLEYNDTDATVEEKDTIDIESEIPQPETTSVPVDETPYEESCPLPSEEIIETPEPISTHILNEYNGTITGPSGKETYYNLPMGKVIDNMRNKGFTPENGYQYWIREDGVKMLGDYIIIAANLNTHPRGSVVMTSLGEGLVCDTGSFAKTNPHQIDIATTW